MSQASPYEATVVERKIHDLLMTNNKAYDQELMFAVSLREEEIKEKAKATNPDQWCYAFAENVRGKFATDLLNRVPVDIFPLTRKLLCLHIASGWLECLSRKDEYFFVRTLREWPTEKPEMARELGNSLRIAIKHHFSLTQKKKRSVARLARFFLGNTLSSEDTNEFCRIVFKALGVYAETEDLVAIGGILAHKLRKN